MRQSRRWITAVVAVAVVGAGLLRGPVAPALADDPVLCELGSGVCETAPDPGDPPGLLGIGQYGADDAQVAAMGDLEAQAVAETMRIHELPASDEAAVRTWDRTEAQAILWGLVHRALSTAPDERTPTQRGAVAWMQGRMGVPTWGTGRAIGEQYVRWAGRDLSTYDQLYPTATVDQLRAFFDGLPEPYDTADRSLARTGYCLFRPPGEHRGEYDATGTMGCGTTPCLTMWGCAPPAPSYDQFVSWGQSTAGGNDALTSPEYATSAAGIAASAAYVVTVASATTAAVGLALTTSVVALTIAGYMTGAGIGASVVAGSALASQFGTQLVNADFLATVGRLGITVAAVITSIVLAVVAGVKVVTEAQLPGEIAKKAVELRDTPPPDVTALSATTDGVKTLFGLFVAATLPLPRPGHCEDGARTGRVCFNAPDIPPPSEQDPRFVVAPVLDDGRLGPEKVVPAIALPGIEVDGTRQVRLHGRWFVTDTVVGAGTFATQSLALPYTTAGGAPALAWLTRDVDGDYLFRTHAARGGTDTIRFRGADGGRWQARIEAWRSPLGQVEVVTEVPVEGQPVAVDAGALAPGNAIGAVSYSWRFERTGCGLSRCVETQGSGFDLKILPSFEPPVSGARVDHTWQQAGSWRAQVTATDSAGHTVTRDVTIDVASAAPSVEVPPGPPRSWSTGASYSLVPFVTQAGAHDTLTTQIDWGDGTSSHAQTGPAADIYQGTTPDVTVSSNAEQPTSVFLTAQHTYTTPGVHTGTITVLNRTGGQDTTTFTVTVVPD